jgi:ketosteroid isomerase-like protein
VVLRSAELFERIRAANEASGQLDWSLVRPDFEIYDHELVDSRVHRGHEGWKRWVADWQQAFEDYTLEPLERVEVDESRILSVHRLRARGRASGVELERTDAQLWTFDGDRLVRMDYYPDYRGLSALGLGPADRFDTGALDELDEPVRRHLAHALRPGAEVGTGTRLAMRGRIKLGAWLPFGADWEGDGRSFLWRARVGRGRFDVLRVLDRYAAGAASMDVRLLGRVPLVHADDEDRIRSAAGRTALEAATWAPASLLHGAEVTWRAESDELIVASWDVPPEWPEVRLRIDPEGALRTASAMRWRKGDGYVPCGGIVHAERRFGDLVIPSRLTVGWRFDTPRWAPFYEAEILSARTEPDG